MIEGADLELFERSLRHANDTTTATELDAALAELGWPDALAVDPRAAVSTQFTLQGGGNVISSALDHVLATALGIEQQAAVVLSPLGHWRPPAQRSGDTVEVDGIGTFALGDQARVILAVTAGEKITVM